jgi:hypothetical protein
MTGTLEDEVRKERQRASILAGETRQRVTARLEVEIRKARKEANVLAEELLVIRESTNERSKAANERSKAASERLRAANEHIQKLEG